MMIKLAGYFLIVGALIALGLWVANQPGSFILNLSSYEIETTPGMFFIAILATTMIIMAGVGWIKWLIQLPFSLRRTAQMRAYKAGVELFLGALEAINLGNTPGAIKLVKRTKDKLSSSGLSGGPSASLGFWIESQVALAHHQTHLAKKAFKGMCDIPASRSLGTYYLAHMALGDQDYPKAAGYLEDLLKESPTTLIKRPWAALNMAKIYLSKAQWSQADVLLEQCQPEDSDLLALKHRLQAVSAFMQFQRDDLPGHDAKVELLSYATEYDISFTPAVMAYAQSLHQLHKEGKCAKILESSWAAHPSFEVGKLYLDYTVGADVIDRFKGAQKLLKSAPKNLSAHLLVMESAVEAQLWGEAKAYLGYALSEGCLDHHLLLRNLLTRCLHDPKSPIFKLLWTTTQNFWSQDHWQCTSCYATRPVWSYACGTCGGLLTALSVEG